MQLICFLIFLNIIKPYVQYTVLASDCSHKKKKSKKCSFRNRTFSISPYFSFIIDLLLPEYLLINTLAHTLQNSQR